MIGEPALRRALRLAVGWYLGTLLVPGVAMLLARGPVPGAVGPGVLAVGIAVVAIVAAIAVRRAGTLAERIAEHPDALLIAVTPPVGYFLVLLGAVAATGRLPGAALLYPAVAGTGAVLPGVLATFLADVAHEQRLLADCTVHAEWTARRPPTARRNQTIAGGLLIGAGALSWVTGFHGPLVAALALLAGALLVFDARDEARYAVTDVGLMVVRDVPPYRFPWRTFDGYGVEGSAFVLRRGGWLGDERFDLADVDRERVERALSRYLERR